MAELQNKLHADQSIAWDGATRTMRINPLTQTAVEEASARVAEEINAEEFGDIFNNTSLLQAAVDHCRLNTKKLILPSTGVINLEDTLQFGGDGAQLGLFVEGAWPSHDGVFGTIFLAEFTDRPAFNLQYLPWGHLKNFTLYGPGAANAPVLAINPAATPDITAYLPDGYLAVRRHNPFCGIAANAYSGLAPADVGDRYPGTYGKAAGGGFLIENFKISGFETAFVDCPNGAQAGGGDVGNSIEFRRGQFSVCAYAVSSTAGNNRNLSFSNLLCSMLHTFYTNNTHGSQGGWAPSFAHAEINSTYRLLKCTNNISPGAMSNISGEALMGLGVWGGSAAGVESPFVFNQCQFHMDTSNPDGYIEPIHMSTGAGVAFRECAIEMTTGVFNTVGDAQPTYTDCWFGATSTWSKDWMVSRGYPVIGGETWFEKVFLRSDAGNHDARSPAHARLSVINSISVLNRIELEQSSTLLNLNDGNLYRVVHANQNHWIGSGVAFSGLAFDDEDEEITFTMTTQGELIVGDVLLWQIVSTNAQLVGQVRAVPAIRVTSVAGAAVTCESLFAWNQIDQAWAHGNNCYPVPDLWAPKPSIAFQATWTTGSTTITCNVNPTTVCRVGDQIIAASGLPAHVRVASMTSTEIILSKLPTSNRTNEPLYQARLVAI